VENFYEWLMKQKGRNDRVGDFARDAEQDPQAIKGWSNFTRWYNYIIGKTRDTAVLETLVQAWGEYDPTAETYLSEEEDE